MYDETLRSANAFLQITKINTFVVYRQLNI